ncbi:MAG: helix-turn-helix domain-containing protein [Rhodospirillaceae bacterium]|jgi:hypothetical protein|nr:helix-turn-helix domain-containing protein [Acidiferrobacteraceae bacterium]MBT5049005.1 helix-turn-helix domain-containing protein [Rhodospirillaceae bacterium]MBT5778853.1 helix-turn-helix domain-containing protein [Rhodospirillaceae bacterium]MBT7293642.1 helix-turn-helix domain-containing protein [Rhodospirillaceae bacterium]
MNDEVLYDAADIRRRLKVGKSKAYELLNEMPHVKIGRCIRVRPAVLQKYLENHSVGSGEGKGVCDEA